MVHRLVVSYGRPDDPGAFDDYYRDTHLPLTMEVPGLVGVAVGHPAPVEPQDTTPYFVAEFDFESEAAFDTAQRSPEGRASAADSHNFASGGVSMWHFEVREPIAGLPEMP